MCLYSVVIAVLACSEQELTVGLYNGSSVSDNEIEPLAESPGKQ